MLGRCDRCQEIQPSDQWRCRSCHALMPGSRKLLQALVGLAFLVALVLLYSLVRSLLG